MSCPCNISISYSYRDGEGAPLFTYTDLEVIAYGILNGKSAYTWTDDNFTYTLYWDGAQWIVVVGYGTEFQVTIATLGEDLDCPGTHETSEWGSLYATYYYFNVTAPCQLTLKEIAELEEVQECYNITVWDLQCKYAQCVLKYFTNLKFGIDNKIEFENLLKKKKTLGILLCYNTKDILLEDTIYNNITYSEIKQLISKF